MATGTIIGIVGYKGSGKDTVQQMIHELAGDTVRVSFADPLKRFCQEVYDWTEEVLWGPSEMREVEDRRYPHPMPDWFRWSDDGKALHIYHGDSAGIAVRISRDSSKANTVTAVVCRDLVTEWGSDRRYFEAGEHLDLQFQGDCDFEVGRVHRDIQGILWGFVTPREALQKLGTEWGRGLYDRTWIDLGIRKAKRILDSEGAKIVVITDCRFANEGAVIRAAGGLLFRVNRPGCEQGRHQSEREQANIIVDEDIMNSHDLSYLRTQVAAVLLSRGLISPEVLKQVVEEVP